MIFIKRKKKTLFLIIISIIFFSCNPREISKDKKDVSFDTIQQLKNKIIKAKYVISDSNKVYYTRIEYQPEILNPKYSNVDTLYVYFETGFDTTVVEMYEDYHFKNRMIYNTNYVTGLAGDYNIGNVSKLKSIGFKINNSKLSEIKLNGNRYLILKIRLRSDTIIYNFANSMNAYR